MLGFDGKFVHWCGNGRASIGGGARRFMVEGWASTDWMHANPSDSRQCHARQQHVPIVCLEQQNIDSQSYNTKLQSLINSKLEASLKDAKVVYFDVYNVMMDMFTNLPKYATFFFPILLLNYFFSFALLYINHQINIDTVL